LILVLTYGLGALIACLSTLGGIGITSHFAPPKWKETKNLPMTIGVFFLIETFIYALLSFTYTLFPLIILTLTLTKVVAGAYFVSLKKVRLTILKGGALPLLWLAFLLINASVPTSNFDCFSAHFPIPELFLEHNGYPIRPDFQYLDALPLSAHLWLIPAFALKLEGYANMVFPIFSALLFWALAIRFPRKLSLILQGILLSIPEFIRISMDPMVDTATFYFVFVGSLFLFSSKNFYWPSIAIFSLAFSIKPTLLPFAPIAFIFLLASAKGKLLAPRPIIWSAISLAIASIWPLKNWILYGSPWFPYFGSSPSPLLPPLPNLPAGGLSLITNYLLTIFADHRFFLSLGWTPLFFFPFLLCIKGKRARLLISILLAGFILTLVLTPFKNRYFLPFILIVLPHFSLLFSRNSTLRRLLWASVAFNLLCFFPYLFQPLKAIIKNQDIHTFYRSKYPSYSGYLEANQLPPGKILLIGQASHWIKRPHQVALPSETHLDFSRINSLDQFEDHLQTHDIKHLVIHSRDLRGMANHPDPWYAKKAYLANITLDWVSKLKETSKLTLSTGQAHGIEWIQLTSFSPSKSER
jgi:hypothetical protein